MPSPTSSFAHAAGRLVRPINSAAKAALQETRNAAGDCIRHLNSAAVTLQQAKRIAELPPTMTLDLARASAASFEGRFHIEEIKGCLVYTPAGGIARTPAVVTEIHGFRGPSASEFRFANKLASGAYRGQPMAVILPLAEKIVPQARLWDVLALRKNLQDLRNLVCYIQAQPSRERTAILNQMMADKRSGLMAGISALNVVRMPQWWHPFAFEKVMADFGTPANDHAPRPALRLRPDLAGMMPAMNSAADLIAERLTDVRKTLGTGGTPEFIVGFSQGVGPQNIVAGQKDARYITAYSTGAVWGTTPNQPPLRQFGTEFVAIVSRADPVIRTLGYTTEDVRDYHRDLARQAKEHGHAMKTRLREVHWGGHHIDPFTAQMMAQEMVAKVDTLRPRWQRLAEAAIS